MCQEQGRAALLARTTEEAFAHVGKTRFGNILVDAREAERGGLRFLEWLRTLWITSPISVFAVNEEELDLIPFARLQLDDVFLVSDSDDFVTHKLTALAKKSDLFSHVFWQEWSDTELHRYTSVRWYPEIYLALQKTQALAREPFLFLITGEKGVGKNLLAQTMLIHAPARISLMPTGLKPAEQKTFVFTQLSKVFVSQQQNGEGLFAALIVEDVENLSSELQAFLENYFRTGRCAIGDQIFIPVLQLIATSTESLDRLFLSGHMSQDLLARFSKQNLAVQPLRERRQDIIHLVDYFIHAWEQENTVRYLSLDAIDALVHYDWPGNAVELKTVVEKLLSATQETTVTAQNLPLPVLQKTFYRSVDEAEDYAALSYAEAKKRMLHKFHRAYISELLRRAQNNLTVAAEKAQLDRSNFKKVMKKFGC